MKKNMKKFITFASITGLVLPTVAGIVYAAVKYSSGHSEIKKIDKEAIRKIEEKEQAQKYIKEWTNHNALWSQLLNGVENGFNLNLPIFEWNKLKDNPHLQNWGKPLFKEHITFNIHYSEVVKFINDNAKIFGVKPRSGDDKKDEWTILDIHKVFNKWLLDNKVKTKKELDGKTYLQAKRCIVESKAWKDATGKEKKKTKKHIKNKNTDKITNEVDVINSEELKKEIVIIQKKLIDIINKLPELHKRTIGAWLNQGKDIEDFNIVVYDTIRGDATELPNKKPNKTPGLKIAPGFKDIVNSFINSTNIGGTQHEGKKYSDYTKNEGLLIPISQKVGPYEHKDWRLKFNHPLGYPFLAFPESFTQGYSDYNHWAKENRTWWWSGSKKKLPEYGWHGSFFNHTGSTGFHWTDFEQIVNKPWKKWPSEEAETQNPFRWRIKEDTSWGSKYKYKSDATNWREKYGIITKPILDYSNGNWLQQITLFSGGENYDQWGGFSSSYNRKNFKHLFNINAIITNLKTPQYINKDKKLDEDSIFKIIKLYIKNMINIELDDLDTVISYFPMLQEYLRKISPLIKKIHSLYKIKFKNEKFKNLLEKKINNLSKNTEFKNKLLEAIKKSKLIGTGVLWALKDQDDRLQKWVEEQKQKKEKGKKTDPYPDFSMDTESALKVNWTFSALKDMHMEWQYKCVYNISALYVVSELFMEEFKKEEKDKQKSSDELITKIINNKVKFFNE